MLFSKDSLQLVDAKTDWSLSMSDHAAIEIGLKFKEDKLVSKSKITRLDPSLLKDREEKEKIIVEVEAMLNEMGDGWNPHLKLEYLKMCIRTVV